MHINEQTSAGLDKLLSRHFSSVVVWVPYPDTIGSLRDGLNDVNLAQARSIFAVAADFPIDRKVLIDGLSQQQLQPDGLDVSLELLTADLQFSPGELRTLKVSITNRSSERMVSRPPYPVNISYHWSRRDGGHEVFEGRRTSIDVPLLPGETRVFDVECLAPVDAGQYYLDLTLVQEACFWFERYVKGLPLRPEASVK